MCHHDLHTLLKRWQLENKTLQFLYVYCFYVAVAPKEKTYSIYYSLLSAKIVQRKRTFLLTSDRWTECLDSFFNSHVDVKPQQLVKSLIRSDLIFSSSHSSTGVLHSHCSIEAPPSYPSVVCRYYMIAVYIPSPPCTCKKKGGLVCRTIMWEAFEWHPMSAL